MWRLNVYTLSSVSSIRKLFKAKLEILLTRNYLRDNNLHLLEFYTIKVIVIILLWCSFGRIITKRLAIAWTHLVFETVRMPRQHVWEIR